MNRLSALEAAPESTTSPPDPSPDRDLLELGESTVYPIAKRSGVKRTTIYSFIDHLVELGLVDQAEVRGRMRYTPRPPESAIALQERRLAELREGLPELLSSFNASARKPKISYFEGKEQVRRIIEEEPRCEKEVLTAWNAKEVTDFIGMDFLTEVDRRRIEAGVGIRVVRIEDEDESFAKLRGGPGQLRDLRYAPSGIDLPMGIEIFDTNKVGFITSRREGFGILVESPEFTQTMRVLFESLWEKSRPAKSAAALRRQEKRTRTRD